MGLSAPSHTSDAPPGVVVRVFACTDVGRTREHNEDAYLVAELGAAEPIRFEADPRTGARALRPDERGILFVVADGLGGAAAGEVASHMAVNAVFDALRSQSMGAGADTTRFASALRDAALVANDAIHKRAQRHRELHGMGTTITAAALLADTIFLAQVGDSRAYLVRDGEARQITKDQSLMQKLVEAGEITPEQAEQSARRNIILQALGPEASVKVDLTHQQLRRGDLLVLCSDGLSGQVRAEEIAEIAARAPDLDVLCIELIARANERGGPDNITVVAARFDGEALVTPHDGDSVGHRAFPLAGVTEEITPALRPITTQPVARPASPVAPTTAAVPAPILPAAVRLERQDRARVYYAALAVAAVVAAAFTLWRLFLAR